MVKHYEVFDYDEPNKSVSVEFDETIKWSRDKEDIIIEEADRRFHEHYGYVPDSYDWEEPKQLELDFLEAVNA